MTRRSLFALCARAVALALLGRRPVSTHHSCLSACNVGVRPVASSEPWLASAWSPAAFDGRFDARRALARRCFSL